MTTAEAYRKSMELLLDSGFSLPRARLEARLLLDDVSGVRYSHLLQPEAVLDAPAQGRLRHACSQLTSDVPLAYLLREREFFGLPFRCDRRALIPRPETEMLVEAAVARLQNLQNHSGALVSGALVSGALVSGALVSGALVSGALVADLGTGTGCIAVSVAHALPQAVIYATDASEDALQLARENARRHGVTGRVEFVAGDADNWAAPLLREGFGAMFDLLLSNPPYIATRKIESLAPQIRDWEPRAALDGGADGLHCYRQLAAQCPVLLKPGGAFIVELGAGQFEAVRAIFEAHNWTVAPPIFDLGGIGRVLVATQAG